MSLSALFGPVSSQLLAQKWGTRIADKNGEMMDTGVNPLAQKLYAILNSQEPIVLNEPIKIVNNTGQAPIQIVQNGGSNDITNVTNEEGDIFNLTQTNINNTTNNNTYVTNFFPPGVPDPTDPNPPGWPDPADPDYPGDNPNNPFPPGGDGTGLTEEQVIALIIRTWDRTLSIEGFLDDALAQPSSASNPETATLSIWRVVDGVWVDTGLDQTITNRDETLELDADTYVRAVYASGEYRIAWAACD